MRSRGTRSTAMTGPSWRSKTSSSWRMQGVGALPMMSSPRNTPNGSSPTRARAHRMAWPRPSGSFCRTYATDATSDADRGEMLTVERRFDPTSEVVLCVETAGGIHPDGEPKHRVTPAESHNTLHRRRVQRSPGLARPFLADPAQHRQRAIDVDVARHGDLHDGAPPAHAEVRELRQGAVGHDPELAVLQSQLHHPQADGLHGAGHRADLDHVAHGHQALEEQEDAGEEVTDERLGAEPDDEAEHARGDDDRLHVHADLAQNEHQHDERQHPAHDAREQRPERARARGVEMVGGHALHEAADQPQHDLVADQQQRDREPEPEHVRDRRVHRPRPRATPSSTAMIASTQPAWMRTTTASCLVASLSSMADRPSVAAMKRISSTVSVRVRPSDSKR